MSVLNDRMQKSAQMVEGLIKELLVPNEPASEEKPLWEAMEYSTMAGGKRIRPFLVMEVCRTLGGRQEEALIYAAALEMIHTYSLIHDDLPCMDNDDLRRGKPTCHKVYGEATALLAGDGLLTRAFELVANAPGILPLRKCYAIAILAEAAGAPGMIGGQQMDLASEGKEIPYETMVAIHEKKTCALLIAACRLGALAAGQRGSEAEDAMITYGMGIGRAFQLVDDLLDVTSTKEVLGKDIGSDQKNKKTTYLTFMPIETAEGLAKAITDKAKEAVEPYDKDGVLTALADYLTERKN